MTAPVTPIGIFDSGFGGLTVLHSIRRRLPQYDYLYLGDNARAPYGMRSYEVVYEFTLQAVKKLFALGCPLVILACNTASAKALRSIQQRYIANETPDRRVLGVIRPTAEVIGHLSHSGHIGVLATEGTVKSGSYVIEIRNFFPQAHVTQLPCPMWVSLVENNAATSPGADYFVKERIDALLTADPSIDTVLLGCTHFPLLLDKIRRYTPEGVTLMPQGEYVARSLVDYLRRHTDMAARLTQGGSCRFLTTESATRFGEQASIFLGDRHIEASHVDLA